MTVLPPPGPAAALAVAAACCLLLAGAGVRLLAVPAFEAPVLMSTTARVRSGSVLDRMSERLGRPFAPLLGRLSGDRGQRALTTRLEAAGGLGGVTVERFLARRAGGLGVGLVILVIYALTGRVLSGLVIGGVIALRADWLLRSAARRRQDQIERTLPDLLDVLSVTILAGASFRVGLARVSQALPGALAEELTTVLRQLEVGVTRRRAFEQLRDRNPSPALRRFVAGVLQAEELGSSLSGVLTDLSGDIRKIATQYARRRADSMDKTIALITTLVLLPAMVLLVLSVFFGSIRVGG